MKKMKFLAFRSDSQKLVDTQKLVASEILDKIKIKKSFKTVFFIIFTRGLCAKVVEFTPILSGATMCLLVEIHNTYFSYNFMHCVTKVHICPPYLHDITRIFPEVQRRILKTKKVKKNYCPTKTTSKS